MSFPQVAFGGFVAAVPFLLVDSRRGCLACFHAAVTMRPRNARPFGLHGLGEAMDRKKQGFVVGSMPPTMAEPALFPGA
jgi:hypothetical protein